MYLVPYAASTAKSMAQSMGYTLPSPMRGGSLPLWLSIELGLLGARLYFDFGEYPALLKHLRTVVRVGGASGNFYAFLLEWLTMRRKGQDILHTPMGYVCQGRPLEASHDFFAARGASVGRVEKKTAL